MGTVRLQAEGKQPQILVSASKGASLRRIVQDIISKRNITRLEMEGINPSVDLDNLEPNQVRQQM